MSDLQLGCRFARGYWAGRADAAEGVDRDLTSMAADWFWFGYLYGREDHSGGNSADPMRSLREYKKMFEC